MFSMNVNDIQRPMFLTHKGVQSGRLPCRLPQIGIKSDLVVIP